MLKEERYDEILKILNKEKYISASKLSERLYVSLPTIRRDLAELHKRGQLIRSHGGAKKIHDEHVVAPLDFRKTINSVIKRQLCQAASDFVHDNDIVFVDATTTTLQIAEFLPKKKEITVITNGIPLATMLAKKGVKTYCTGGEIFENSFANVGSFAEDFIRNFNIDVTIFSCHGVTNEGILCDPSLSENQIRETAISQSKKTVFLCDESKISLSAPFNLLHISEIDHIVSNTMIVAKIFNLPKNKVTIV